MRERELASCIKLSIVPIIKHYTDEGVTDFKNNCSLYFNPYFLICSYRRYAVPPA
jgi:hypothetical protein